MSRAEIESAIPHRGPMLLVDEIVQRGHRRHRLPEDVSRGRVLLPRPLSRTIRSCPASSSAKRPCRPAQSCCPRPSSRLKAVPVATRMNDVKFKRMVRPGETIEIDIKLTERLANAFFLQAESPAVASWPSASVRLHRGGAGLRSPNRT